MIYRPVRERPHEEVIEAAGELIANCGYDEVSLVSLNTTDYAGIDELVAKLTQRYPNLTLSLPSLRLDDFSVKLIESLPTRSRTGLTLPPRPAASDCGASSTRTSRKKACWKRPPPPSSAAGPASSCISWSACPPRPWRMSQGIVTLVEKVRADGQKGQRQKADDKGERVHLRPQAPHALPVGSPG